MLDVDPGSFDLDVVRTLPSSVSRHISRAAKLSETARKANAPAAAERRAAAHALREQRVPVDDIGRVLGVSKQRASQLTKAS